ncbi:hypothetical protein SNE40_018882 [Patella caerulea]|uniref:Uncharacterized protein n=1 Tax=Patella caerulea TaxID=87958 RepID=A0AAN8P4R8_PATCE
MNHQRRGKAVVINNVNFSPTARLRRRDGSRQDYDSISKCMRSLRFEVEAHEDKGKDEILKIFEKVANEDHSNADCLLVSLMSHGGEEGICGNDYNRYQGTGLLTLNDITEPFKGDRCPTLVGKPKIFILNACRGDEVDPGVEEYDQTDSRQSFTALPKIHKIPIDADIFVCFSCSQGYSTLRDPFSGSYFVQDLCSVFKEYGEKLHLSELVLKVKEMVAARQIRVQGSADAEMQMPVVLDTLRKLVYFDKPNTNFVRPQPSEEIYRLIRQFDNLSK